MTDKRQAQPLTREGTWIGQDGNCPTVNKHLVFSPRWGLTTRHTQWLITCHKVTLTLTKLLSLRNKCILAEDLNVKHPFRSSAVSKPSGLKLLQLFDLNYFSISASQCSAHYSPVGNEDVQDIVVYNNLRHSYATVSNFLDSCHLPVIFQI
jgi:hypothetical protein